MDFGRWAFKNRALVHFLVWVFVIGGVFSAWKMSKLEDPEIKVKMAMVITAYPGASAHEVEMQVTDPLEKRIRSMSGVDNTESYSYADFSLIQVELLSTTPNDEVEQYWDQLRRKVSDGQADLPSGARPSVVRDDFSEVYGMFYALTCDGMSEFETNNYANLIKRELINIDGVDRVQIYGTQKECINVRLLQDKLSALGVSPVEVLQTLEGQNKAVYAGYYDNGDQRVRVHIDDRFTEIENIQQMLVRGHENDELRMCDIARVEKGFEQPVRNEMKRDGKRALGVLIAPTPGEDIVKIGEKVENLLDELRETRFPTGVEMTKIFYQPERVTAALSDFIINLVESVLIVVFILMLTMGFKSGLIIGVSLVVIVCGTFMVLLGFDGTMQRVSLGSFILAMGMLVDNAIVIIDGILVDLKRGVPRREAMVNIGKRTAMPLLGATLIAILSFLPIFLSPDTAGLYVRDLFIVLAVSLLLSWILALVHVPLMANSLLAKGNILGLGVKAMSESLHSGETLNKEDQGIGDNSVELSSEVMDDKNSAADNESTPNSWPYRATRALLTFGLKPRYLNLALIIGAMVLAGVLYPHMRQGFFPDMVYDQAYMEYKLPEGYNSTRVRKDLAEIEAWLKMRPEVKHVTTSIGGTPGRYNLVRTIATPSLAYGELIIDFTSPDDLKANVDEIQEYLTHNYPEAYCKLKLYNLMYKKYPIEAMFTGPDPAVLHALTDSAQRIMKENPHTSLVTTDWAPSVPVINIGYDQNIARQANLSRSDVGISVLTATGGIPVSQIHEGIYSSNIYVKTDAPDGKPVEDLSSLQVFSMLPNVLGAINPDVLTRLRSGKFDRTSLIEGIFGTMPLAAASDGITVRWEDPVIPRFNGCRMQRAQCSPAPGCETERTRKELAKQIEQIKLPAGYSLKWMGERQASQRSMKYLFANFPMAIILMIAILIMLFTDYRKTGVILLTIPLVFVGVVLTILATGKVFSFVAIVGALGLIGMVIKNGIVLMDEINLQIEQGKPVIEALISSSLSRLRPVMMASLTTILGMIPLLGDAMFGSLAATIMGGLFFGTIITLLFVPILYALFFNVKYEK